jgi:putative ABC transport system permease protein
MKNLGDNLIWVEAGSRAPNGVRSGARGTKTLVMADAVAIANEVHLVKAVSPQVDGRVQVIYANTNWNTTYRGVTPEFFQIRRWAIEQGAMFTEDDVDRAADVCVIGKTVRDQLFGATDDPIGKIMRVKDAPCRVIGVTAAKGQSSFGQDQDDQIFLPYTTAQKKIAGITWLNDIMCSAVSAEAVQPATQQIMNLVRERHRIRPGQDDDFNLRSPQDMIQLQLEASRTFTLLLVSIAAVSLLVGGIGIMNVMLVSVTERTREIGVRMAVGATEANVQTQFLGEAIMLSLFGGVLGVGAGVGGSIVIGRMLQWPMQVPPQAIVIAAAFSIAVGAFFGYYPARKASRLDPIEALRFE